MTFLSFFLDFLDFAALERASFSDAELDVDLIELSFNLIEDEELVLEEMKYAFRLSVPLDVSYGFGTNWMEIK